MRGTPRISARAAVLEEQRVLLTRNRQPHLGEYYLLPGGGIRLGEALDDAVRREVREETGYHVLVNGLLWVRDFVVGEAEQTYEPPGWHGVELIFACTPLSPPARSSAFDTHQIGTEWFSGADLDEIAFFPVALVDPLRTVLIGGDLASATYLGNLR